MSSFFGDAEAADAWDVTDAVEVLVFVAARRMFELDARRDGVPRLAEILDALTARLDAWNLFRSEHPQEDRDRADALAADLDALRARLGD